jgi:hypothetical protein
MTARRSSSPHDNLCPYKFSDGRTCGMPGLASLDGYCRPHSKFVRFKGAEEEADLSFELPYSEGKTLSEQGIEHALNVIFHAYAAKRISIRRAATFGYLAQLMLVSKRGTKLLPEAAQAGDQLRALLHNAYSNKPPKPIPHVNKP